MNTTNQKVLELLAKQGVDPESQLGQELISKYESALKQKQEELKNLEISILNMAEDDFLKSIKN